MTAAPLQPSPFETTALAAASACAEVLPTSEQLEAGLAQPGTEHVTEIFAGAAVADLSGAVTGRLGVLVGEDLVQALSSSPMGELDLAAAVQPALDAAAAALGSTAQPARVVDLEMVVTDMAGDFTAIPLVGSAISAALLVPDSTLATAETVAASASGETPAAPPAAAPSASAAPAAAGTPVGAAEGTTGALPPMPASPPTNVRSIVEGRRGIEMLHGVEMEVTVELGRTRMPVRDLLALAPGTVLALDRAAGSPADLLVNGRLIARGEVVVVDEDFGLRVTEIVDQSAVG